jgi:RNase H-fold protein (predicted Holliday junction resolvase)
MAKTKYTTVQKALLAEAFGRDVQTINRWIKNNDDRLTSDKARKALAKKVVS